MVVVIHRNAQAVFIEGRMSCLGSSIICNDLIVFYTFTSADSMGFNLSSSFTRLSNRVDEYHNGRASLSWPFEETVTASYLCPRTYRVPLSW